MNEHEDKTRLALLKKRLGDHEERRMAMTRCLFESVYR